jgi:putative membrane protein
LSSVFGYLLELVGVKTGFPFGNYEYHETLGLKLFDVPLVIGINWFILSYCFSNLVSNYFKNIIAAALIGSLLMTSFDFIIEPVAIKLDYWQWENNTIPIANYLSWFVAGAIIQYFYHQKVHKINNPLTFSVILGQLIYFLSVLLFW